MDGAWDWQADWCSGRSNADIVLVCHGEERAESEDKSLDRSVYVPTLTYGHKLWVMTKRIRSQIQAAKMSFLAGWRAAPLEIGWGALSPRRSLEHIKRSQLRWLGHLYTWTPSSGGVPGMPHREKTLRKNQDTLEWLCHLAGLGTPWDPLRRGRGSVQGEGSLGVPAQTAAPATQPQISGRSWMDGWIFVPNVINGGSGQRLWEDDACRRWRLSEWLAMFPPVKGGFLLILFCQD